MRTLHVDDARARQHGEAGDGRWLNRETKRKAEGQRRSGRPTVVLLELPLEQRGRCAASRTAVLPNRAFLNSTTHLDGTVVVEPTVRLSCRLSSRRFAQSNCEYSDIQSLTRQQCHLYIQSIDVVDKCVWLLFEAKGQKILAENKSEGRARSVGAGRWSSRCRRAAAAAREECCCVLLLTLQGGGAGCDGRGADNSTATDRGRERLPASCRI